MATEKQITEKWGATHHIQKQRLVGEIDLSYLNKNESVAMGDGETYYWLLTEKDEAESPLPIDWDKLRDQFFNDNTRTVEMGITGDFEMTEFKTRPHNVFEWFKRKIGPTTLR